MYFLLISLFFGNPNVNLSGMTLDTDSLVIVYPKTEKKSRLRKDLTQFAETFVGKKYASRLSNDVKLDCSGYVQYVYANYGISLDRSSSSMVKQGSKKRKADAGDLMFFAHNGRINHVAIVLEIKDNRTYIIHSTSSKGVIIECFEDSDYWKSRFVCIKDVIN
jgi:cell wall-associated NlpC family hydrolase